MNIRLRTVFATGLGALFLTLSTTIPAFASNSPVHIAALSKAEGADRTKAARANEWVGLIIGVNDGARMFVITEASALNHIKGFAQRSVYVSETTSITSDEEPIEFADLPIGQKVTVRGTYNSAKRIIYATEIEMGRVIAKIPDVIIPPPAPATLEQNDTEETIRPVSNENKEKEMTVSNEETTSQTTTEETISFNRNLRTGDRGEDVVALQKILNNLGYLYLPKNTHFGYFGLATTQALKIYQRKIGVPPSGLFGPMTRGKINN